ncbi:unnamed protein product [Symbiodinium microadriaticum]|nr:unnamed protein product [Symbiodinium microadriaticum]
MNDDDVIEVGADGAFDIPSPEKPPPVPTRTVISPAKAPTFVAQDILKTVGSGEYKLLGGSDSDEMYLVINLDGYSKYTDVKVAVNEIIINFQDAKPLKVNVSEYDIDTSTVNATSWQHYLTFRLAKNANN